MTGAGPVALADNTFSVTVTSSATVDNQGRYQAVAPGATLRSTDYKPLMRTRAHKPRLMACDPDPAVLDFITAIASPWYSVIGARDPGWAKAWLLQHRDIVACVAGEKLTSGEGLKVSIGRPIEKGKPTVRAEGVLLIQR